MNATHNMTTASPGVNSGNPVTRVSGSLAQCEAYAALCRSKGWYEGSVIAIVPTGLTNEVA